MSQSKISPYLTTLSPQHNSTFNHSFIFIHQSIKQYITTNTNLQINKKNSILLSSTIAQQLFPCNIITINPSQQQYVKHKYNNNPHTNKTMFIVLLDNDKHMIQHPTINISLHTTNNTTTINTTTNPRNGQSKVLYSTNIDILLTNTIQQIRAPPWVWSREQQQEQQKGKK